MSKCKKITAKHLIKDYGDLERKLKRQPTCAEYAKNCHSMSAAVPVFGKPAWSKILKAVGRKPNPSALTAEHLIQDFLLLQKKLGRRPSVNAYMVRCHTPKVLDRVFGKSGWKNMLRAVGAKALPKHAVTADHLVEDYLELSRRLGRKPVFAEFLRMQEHSLNLINRAFGRPGWRKLTIAAQRKMRKLAN